MVARCHTLTNTRYGYYGARGIRVCDAWRGPGGFAQFLADVGEKPSPKHSLDRVDNSGHYEPGNVRWVTHREQCRNRRSSVLISHGGRTMCVWDWAAELGVTPWAIYRRIDRGMSPVEAITKPFRRIPRK